MGKFLTTDLFIEKAKKIHGDKYGYSKVEYTRRDKKVVITCHTHGDFLQTPRAHLSGFGCRKCANYRVGQRRRDTKEDFITKALKKHAVKYDYSKVNYINSRTKVEIICPKHGSFWQYPSSHLQGFGCPSCGGIFIGKNIFVERSKKIHSNKYDYSLVDYKNYYKKVKIICLKHGIFEQTPDAHLKGEGCPVCRESKGERSIKHFLTKKGLSFKQQHRINQCRRKFPLPFDFAVFNEDGSLRCLIEYQGEQHFRPVKTWGGIENLLLIKERDEIKRKYCLDNNIPLYYVSYKEDVNTKLEGLL